jgi:recombination DNA repair RAD52 pathway protein
MSHVQAYDVAAHLTRIFGFGNWEKHITELDLVCEDSTKDGAKTRWTITYKCRMTLVIKDPAGNVIWSGDDGATGSAQNQPSRGDAHDLALKNAISYALKRCAKDWGDQFGLSLYNKGDMNALVVATLAQADDEARDVEQNLPEINPDDDAELAQGEPDASQAVAAQERAEASQDAGPSVAEKALADWAVKIDGITSRDDATAVDGELVKAFKAGGLDNTTANAIRGAITAKVASLPAREMAGAR